MSIVTKQFERSNSPVRPGWILKIKIGPGAGRRWIDLPGHSMNVAHTFRRRLYISGRTFTLCRNAKCHFPDSKSPVRTVRIGQIDTDRKRHKWAMTGFTSNGNADLFPGWWI